MTTSERKAQTNTAGQAHPAAQPERQIPHRSPDSARRPTVLRGRPRSVEGEEAYLRSMMEQAATDIAAGW